jgi:hypothetical protein
VAEIKVVTSPMSKELNTMFSTRMACRWCLVALVGVIILEGWYIVAVVGVIKVQGRFVLALLGVIVVEGWCVVAGV